MNGNCHIASGARHRPPAIAIAGMTLLLIVLYSWMVGTQTAVAAEEVRDEITPRDRQAIAILRQRCLPCHGDDPEELKGELDLRGRSGMLAGGESGEPSIVPGRAGESLLYRAIRWDGLEMPPKQNDRLSEDEIAIIGDWIMSGAVWPDPSSENGSAATWDPGPSDGVQVATSGGLSDDWTRRTYDSDAIWAYQPLTRVPLPGDAHGAVNPIDAFIRRRLKQEGFVPAPPADERTLIRRLTFDLTGLPPTPADIDSLRAEESETAYFNLVEQLLESPHYGEQMARHWLDIVRYADTSGFSNDYERPHAWRYRDYVVRSFNADKPYDRFVIEQIAGDELDPSDPDCLIAPAFLRMGPWEHTAMTVAAVTRQQFLDDVTQSIGVTFLGQALRCARCHDHKFDPVPTRDYYKIQAVFAPAQFVDRELAFQPDETVTDCEAERIRVNRLADEARDDQQQLQQLRDQRREDYLREHGLTSIDEIPEEKRRKSFGLTDREQSLSKIFNSRKKTFARAAARFEPLAMSVYSGPDNGYKSTAVTFRIPRPAERAGDAATVRILTGGDLASPGENVTPGVLSVLASQSPGCADTAAIPETTHGRRLAFARWVADPDNPLAARVMVNRIWQMHFGTGLVATPNNFGKMGARPTHSELLDWLAAWFIEQDWSVKSLHRLIVTSETYRQSGAHPDIEAIAQVDPNNSLLSYFPPRRMSAEELRDAMLSASGELNPQMGGPGIFPEINWDIALQLRHTMGAPAPAYQPSPLPRQRNRRSLYAFRYRTLADPFMEVFDRPGSDLSCDRRNQTTVTPQVFALFNGLFARDRAIAMASRLEESYGDRPRQIANAFRVIYGRTPTEQEVQRCVEHLKTMEIHHQKSRAPVVPLPTTVEREMFEELTGETFTYTEELDVMTGYQADLKPWDVSPETRALAELCLVLLNSNEFLYIR